MQATIKTIQYKKNKGLYIDKNLYSKIVYLYHYYNDKKIKDIIN